MSDWQLEHELPEFRVRRDSGDLAADADLDRRFGPLVERMVRRVVRLGRAVSPIEHQILAASRRIGARSSEPLDQNALIGLMTRQLCRALIAAAPERERVRPAAETAVYALETATAG